MRRYRPAISVALFVVVGLLIPVSAVAFWADSTIYDSDTFSRRSVEILDSPVVRKQLAGRITEQLARAGNQQAVNFRPAFQFAVEVAADTDTFQAIFRNAVRRVHQALLADRSTATGLDLSDSLSIITATVQLPGTAQAGAASKTSGLANTLDDVTRRLSSMRVWSLEDIVASVALGSLLAGIALAVAGIAVALDRRKAVVRLGWALALGGVLILLLRWGAELAALRTIRDGELADAVGDALARTTDDLKLLGLWLVGYGIVIAAAASDGVYTPAAIADRFRGWAERRRATRKGTVGLAVVLVLTGLLVTTSPWFWVQAAASVVGLWLVYLGVSELVALVRSRAVAAGPAEAGSERRRLVAAGVAVATVLAVVTGGFLVLTRRAADAAASGGRQVCNGEEDLCDVRLDEVVLPGSHNAMSSSLYPGWLFAEHVSTIRQQLDNGVRALLIDTHYGVPSTVRVVGADSQLVLTDRAAELSSPTGDDADPAIEERARALASRATPAANAQRDIYLCHNFCEMGAVRFASVLADVKAFLDANPDEVVALVIQDATTPADTAKVIADAGLADQAATLREGEPLPTLRDLIDDGTRLLVFAEQGGPGAPAWYHKAYDWFQETPYTFTSVDDFSCAPNRGSADNPLFLVNHWVEASPPDPSKASTANSRAVLAERLERCLQERGRVPNVVAVDFAERGDLVPYVRELDQELRDLARSARRAAASTTAPASTVATTAPSTTTPPTTAPSTTLPTSPTTAPPTRVVTDLSGGDPVRFCAAEPAASQAVQVWATALVASATDDLGAVDLAYAPLVARTLDPVVSTAPTALAGALRALRERFDPALDELGKLLPEPGSLDEQATLAQALLSGADEPDPVTVQLGLMEQLEQRAGSAAVQAAAARLRGTFEDRLTIDLGYVPVPVAEAAGYACLVDAAATVSS